MTENDPIPVANFADAISCEGAQPRRNVEKERMR